MRSPLTSAVSFRLHLLHLRSSPSFPMLHIIIACLKRLQDANRVRPRQAKDLPTYSSPSSEDTVETSPCACLVWSAAARATAIMYPPTVCSFCFVSSLTSTKYLSLARMARAVEQWKLLVSMHSSRPTVFPVEDQTFPILSYNPIPPVSAWPWSGQ